MAAGAGALAVSANRGFAAAAGAKKRNVLFIPVDDLRPELGCYGHPLVKSPNIDRLAAEGIQFMRTYCQQAICAASRSSLLTGCRPDTTTIYGLETPMRQAMPDVLSLPQHFRNNGYATIRLGKVYHHFGDDKAGWSEMPDKAGGAGYCVPQTVAEMNAKRAEGKAKGLTGRDLTRYCRGTASEAADVPDNAYNDGAITDAALAMLETHKDEPFFLAVGYHKPHLPFNCPKKYWDLYDRSTIALPDPTEPAGAPPLAFTNWGELRVYSDIPRGVARLDDAKTRELLHAYYACVSYIDAQIGRLLAKLDELGLRENTVVIVWGDHGWKLGEYGDWCKHTNFEYDTHVPMIVRAPGFAPGQKCVALTEFVDIYPTLAELCGLQIPAHLEGTSTVPLFRDPGRKWKRAAFSQYPRNKKGVGKVMGYSLRTERWRYTEWRVRDTGAVTDRELYDHTDGPFAKANLADKPEHAALVRELEAIMKAGWRGALPPAE
ncbi:MAG: sulfatase [Kiritimatiellae bacterium]|nr:sulfatase [Kiritimatiellia bacterium]